MMLHAFDLDLLLRSVHRTDPSCKLCDASCEDALQSKVYLLLNSHFCEAFQSSLLLFCPASHCSLTLLLNPRDFRDACDAMRFRDAIDSVPLQRFCSCFCSNCVSVTLVPLYYLSSKFGPIDNSPSAEARAKIVLSAFQKTSSTPLGCQGNLL